MSHMARSKNWFQSRWRVMTQINNKFESTNHLMTVSVNKYVACTYKEKVKDTFPRLSCLNREVGVVHRAV